MSKITAAESFEAEVVWLGLPRRNTIAVSIEMDRPVLSRTLHGFLLPHRAVRSFLNVGAAAACKVAAEDALDCLTTGCVSRHKVECSVKNMFKEGAYWGAAAGAFEAIEYGVELMRGRSDWKNAMIGGAIAGALISAANSTHRGNRRVIKDAIAGGAIGTAVDFISHRRHVVFGPIRLDDTDGIDQMWDIPRNANKNGVKMDRSWDFKDASDWICGMWAKGRTSPTQQ
ncbi:hypothetical protein PAHAL_3G091400 [Panicum hallii]|uniref:Uncharacterized protein n=2 Tax=Panicum hallii TaxID=206008 RepID=A0A2T8KHL6_9POAL|nr:hypothetical protein PAHAL_3G091400 [Panicum hallii]